MSSNKGSWWDVVLWILLASVVIINLQQAYMLNDLKERIEVFESEED